MHLAGLVYMPTVTNSFLFFIITDSFCFKNLNSQKNVAAHFFVNISDCM